MDQNQCKKRNIKHTYPSVCPDLINKYWMLEIKRTETNYYENVL